MGGVEVGDHRRSGRSPVRKCLGFRRGGGRHLQFPQVVAVLLLTCKCTGGSIIIIAFKSKGSVFSINMISG
jgi:hypothetical protein